MNKSLSFLILFLLLFASFSLTFAQPGFWAGFWFHYCGKTGNYTDNSTFATNLKNLLSNITASTRLPNGGSNFYNLTAGKKIGDDWVAVIALCRAGMPITACNMCFSDAVNEIRQICPQQREAMGWYQACMIRYSNRPISGIIATTPKFPIKNSANASDPVAFNRQLMVLLPSLQAKAAVSDNPKWAAGSRLVSGSQSVYATVQCGSDLNARNCSKCLEDLFNYIPHCCYGKIGGAVESPSCDFRFDVFHFWGDSLYPPSFPLTGKGDSRRKKKLLTQLSIAIGIPTFIAILLAIIGIWILQYRQRKAMQTANKEIKEMIAAEALQFDLATIKVATRNFSLDNKLGKGGFGEVYKGKLASGEEIAVKRLSKNSRQGIVEFKTEVALIAKLQHKNLVKLMGFCLTLKEKILVYEFLSNSSVDRFLFDPTKSIELDWCVRFKMIFGIARGLLYLHEDSRLKVIHRDLKSSNILLYEAMNPKISDFGLAKLFDIDETQGSTKRIVGTYGYMAPEYALTGHYSVKSDVFSFGVIVLEILSGQKNRYSTPPQIHETLLHRAWRLWNEGKILDLVDPTLGNKYPMEELTKCIHIGLLSVQVNPNERPKMASIVAALNGDSNSLPDPKSPLYLGSTRGIGGTSNVDIKSHALPIEIEELEASVRFTESITSLNPR